MRRETIDRAREKAMEFIDATHEVEAEYLEKGPVVFVAGSPATGLSGVDPSICYAGPPGNAEAARK